jgi:hypothetical protein
LFCAEDVQGSVQGSGCRDPAEAVREESHQECVQVLPYKDEEYSEGFLDDVEDYANKFQSLVAEIVTMPPSEADLLQKFGNGLKPDMQIAAGIDPSSSSDRI